MSMNGWMLGTLRSENKHERHTIKWNSLAKATMKHIGNATNFRNHMVHYHAEMDLKQYPPVVVNKHSLRQF